MSKKRPKNHGEEEGGEAWLLPYSDLMTLLLAVFIVLFAVSKVDEKKAKDMSRAFSEGMMTVDGGAGVMSGHGDAIIPLYPDAIDEDVSPVESTNETESTEDSTQETISGTDNASQETIISGTEGATQEDATSNTDTATSQAGLSDQELEQFLGTYELDNLKELQTKFQELFINAGMTDVISTSIDSRGLVISLSNSVLFDSGSAKIKSENEDTLNKMAGIINGLDNYIRIEGHTDNHPISTTTYPSNWELSTARASSVVRFFVDKCSVSPEKLVAVGYGEYKPIADNATAEGRSKNRRIDIIVMSEKYNNLEDQNAQ